MDNSDRRMRFNQLIADHFGVASEQLQGSNSLVADLSADSLDYAEIMMELEEEFNVKLAGRCDVSTTLDQLFNEVLAAST